MKKPASEWAKLLTDIPPAKVYDQNALTMSELVKNSGRTNPEMKIIANDNVRSGKWEMVWKRTPTGASRAYRKALK